MRNHVQDLQKMVQKKSECQFCGWKCFVDARCQMRIFWMVLSSYKGNSNSNNHSVTTKVCWRASLNTQQMVYNSWRPHRVPLLSTETTIHTSSPKYNRRLKKSYLVCWFLLWHLNGRVRIWHKQHGSMDPSLPCINGSGCYWWGCNGVGDIFLPHFGPLDTN